MSPALMVAMEGVCLAFLLVVLSAYIFLPRSKRERKDWFLISLILDILGVTFDIISWICELGPSSQILQSTANFFALVMTCFIVSAFGYYITDLINEKQYLSKCFAHTITAVNIAGAVVAAIAGFSGKLYEILPDTPGPGIMTYSSGGFFYTLPMILATASLAFLFGLVLFHSKALGRQRLVVISIYFVFPLLISILELIDENLLLSYVAISISFSIVYVMLQSKDLDAMLMREKLLNEFSYMDQLTGLLNRRACDRDLEKILKDDNVSIVFCDLNGLKRINDEKGHKAGDQFLISFANIITRHFSHDSVYRISGDEFIVIARGISKEEFEKSVDCLRREIDENAGIAALGTISGTGDAIPMLVRKAEMNMYADKKNFYRHNPEYKRELNHALNPESADSPSSVLP